jgi:hypothetical protein
MKLKHSLLLFEVPRAWNSSVIPEIKQYCLYLKRRKYYAELLSELHDTYTHLANNYSMVSMSLTAHGADLTDLLNDVPWPYDQYVSFEKALEIGRLEILFSRPAEFSVRKISDINSAMSFDFSFQHDLVLERNKSKAMDDDDLMEDCKSSNNIRSDLYREWYDWY